MEKSVAQPLKVERWFDRYERVWTAYVVDKNGNQISDAQHDRLKSNLSLNANDYNLYN